MAIDGLTLFSIKEEFKEKLIGGKLDKIYQPEIDELNINIRNNRENHKLLISADPSLPKVYLADNFTKENPLKAPIFLMILRKYILNSKIVNIRQLNCDRVLFFDLSSTNELKEKKDFTLVIEIMGKHSNIILKDENNIIVDAIKRIPHSVSSYRQVLAGKKYITPPLQDKLNPILELNPDSFTQKILSSSDNIQKTIYNSLMGFSPLISKQFCYEAQIDPKTLSQNITNVEIKHLYNIINANIKKIKAKESISTIVFDKEEKKYIDFSCIELSVYSNSGFEIEKSGSMSEICSKYFTNKDFQERIQQKSKDLKKVISNKIENLENKIEKQSEEINQSIDLEKYKKNADLLTSYIYLLKEGMKEITVTDFYDGNQPEVLINLDENKSPSENIQSLYKKYNKLKHRRQELSIQIEHTKNELNYLYSILQTFDNITSINELQEIRQEMVDEGIIKSKKETEKNKKKNNDTSEPLLYKSKDGTEIFVGKNNKQNDFLTHKFAKKDDIWLHTKDIPGSHVIIKTNGNEINDDTLIYAAKLAAYHSKAKNSSSVPVDYTKKSFVKKPSGAKPGMVIFTENQTLYVTPDNIE